jgi:hypothetical protein
VQGGVGLDAGTSSQPPDRICLSASLLCVPCRASPLSTVDCNSLTFIAEARLLGLTPQQGPDCVINAPASTGAKVRGRMGLLHPGPACCE